jgi:hypothetical protein
MKLNPDMYIGLHFSLRFGGGATARGRSLAGGDQSRSAARGPVAGTGWLLRSAIEGWECSRFLSWAVNGLQGISSLVHRFFGQPKIKTEFTRYIRFPGSRNRTGTEFLWFVIFCSVLGIFGSVSVLGISCQGLGAVRRWQRSLGGAVRSPAETEPKGQGNACGGAC